MKVEETCTIFSQFCLQNVTIVSKRTDYSVTILHKTFSANEVCCESMHSESM